MLKFLKRRRTDVATYEEVERAEYIFYLNYLRAGMTIFDAGANVGELTLLFSRFATASGRVHAFEASRAVHKRLTNICQSAHRPNVVLNHLALAEAKKMVRLHVYEDRESGFNSLAARPLKQYGVDLEPVAIEEVAATTVDDYCEENGVREIDLLKIDVEGAELQVILGARKMMESKRIKCLVFEFGQTTFDMGNRPEQIEDFLGEMKYSIRNIVEDDPIFPGRESVAAARFSMHVATA